MNTNIQLKSPISLASCIITSHLLQLITDCRGNDGKVDSSVSLEIFRYYFSNFLLLRNFWALGDLNLFVLSSFSPSDSISKVVIFSIVHTPIHLY